MENHNRTNKGRNKFGMTPLNPKSAPFIKKPTKMMPMMNYDNNPLMPNEEYYMNQPYPMPNMYPIQMPLQNPQTKEQNLKNMFKMYQMVPKNNKYMQFNPVEYMNINKPGESEMSLEDNAQMGFKKFNNKWNKARKQNKRKNNYKANKDIMINPNNKIFMEGGPGPTARAVSLENNYNNDEEIPIIDYNNDELNFNNNFGKKGGRKKPTTVEHNNNNTKKNRQYKYNKLKFDEIIGGNNDNSNNIKVYNNRSNSISDIENDIDNDSNNENIIHPLNEEAYNNTDEEKNSQDIVILEEDNTPPHKEILDIKKIKLFERPENSESQIIQVQSKSSFSENKSSNPANINIIPELEEMCSEKEIAEREKEKDLDRFEIDADAFPINKAEKSKVVQKYKWKRGKILNLNDPKELRTVSAINKSIKYLIEEILDSDTKGFKLPEQFTITPMDIIQFIADRFIAICKTIEILVARDKNVLNNSDFVSNIGAMIRTTVIFLNLCLDYFDDSPQKIKSFMDDLLLPLLNIIKDMIFNESKYEYNLSLEDKDEFLSYDLFIQLKKDRAIFPKKFYELKDTLLKGAEGYAKVELVNEIYEALISKNFENFMKILKNDEKCDFLSSCFMSLFFKEVCVEGLKNLSTKYKELSYRQILNFLTFEDTDEIREFLIWYGITKDKSRYVVNDSDMVQIGINNKNKVYNYDTAPQKTNTRYIESKMKKKLRKDIVLKGIILIKNNNFKAIKEIKEELCDKEKETQKEIIKNNSLFNSDIKNNSNRDKNLNIPNTNANTNVNTNVNELKDSNINININNSLKKEIINNKNVNPLDESFISKGSFNNLFPTNLEKNSLNINLNKENINNSEKKIIKDEFLRPLSPKKKSFDVDKQNTSNSNIILTENNKSLDLFSHPSISSIEGQYKCLPNFNEQTIEFFCDVASSIINKILCDRKLDFIYRLKFIVEKYKIKLELIENYIHRRKFFVFNEFKKSCLNKKYTREYYKELVNYNSNLNSENTMENKAFKCPNQNLISSKKFELLTYEDIIYFLVKDYISKDGGDKAGEDADNDTKEKELINHIQINIYTTKDLIKSTKIISSLKLKSNLLKENSDGSELTIVDNNIEINKGNKLTFIMKFIFVDQIIDLDSYIYDNQKNISKYSILIPFFDIIKSDPENQQILTKFFTILDLGLGSFIKKDIIFFFIKRDIEQDSDLYKDYQNVQNDFIFNLIQKYSTYTNKNNIIYVDENYENNKELKEKIIYLSPIDEFGKCYQEYIKYLNNKTFVELFENNKNIILNTFDPKEKLIPFDEHIAELQLIINYYMETIEEDLQNYLKETDCINYFYNNKLIIEILIGFAMTQILIVYYQYICLSFANELFKIPFLISNNDLLILEDNLLNSGGIFKQVNVEGYNKLWTYCLSLDNKKKKNIFSYFDVFSDIIYSYNLISDIDIQNYEYCFRKQYYNIDLEKKNYEISKNFVNYFNKIISKFASNNDLNIRNNNAEKIFEKIYTKNKNVLLNNVSKILTNNSICFNEGLIYLNGLGSMYAELEKVEYNKNLSKKRRRNIIKKEGEKMQNEVFDMKKKYNEMVKTEKINMEGTGGQVVNNMIDINESNDKSKRDSSNIGPEEIEDANETYYKYFRKIKKYSIPSTP